MGSDLEDEYSTVSGGGCDWCGGWNGGQEGRGLSQDVGLPGIGEESDYPRGHLLRATFLPSPFSVHVGTLFCIPKSSSLKEGPRTMTFRRDFSPVPDSARTGELRSEEWGYIEVGTFTLL